MSGCSHRPVVAPLVAVPHVLQSALRFPHPCLQPPALLYSFPINQSIARLLFYTLQVAFSYIWPPFSFFYIRFFGYFLIFIFFCVCFLIFYFLTFSFLSVLFLFFVNSFRLFDGWALFVFGCLFIYPACRFGNLFSLFSFFVVFGYHSITSVLQSTSAVSHWWSDWTHPDQPVWGCLNSVLAVLLHHLELIQLSKKTNLYMLNI